MPHGKNLLQLIVLLDLKTNMCGVPIPGLSVPLCI